MSPQAEETLANEVAPRVRPLTLSFTPVGAEDREELTQDAVAVAATLLASAEARHKKVSPGNISYYAARLVKQGRRSTGQSATDVMAPRTQLAGRSRMVSMDACLTEEAQGEEPMCLHDVLAGRSEDPALAASRRLDWQSVLAKLDTTAHAVLVCLAREEEI